MKIYLNSYLENNLGDDLFVKILLERYKNHQFYSITTNKTYNNRFKNLNVFSQPFIVKIIKKFGLKKIFANKCDIAITLGGSMYIQQKGDENRSLSIGKKPHYILGANVGPYSTQKYFEKVYTLFQEAEDVCLRETYSYELFKDIKQVRKASDIVFSLNSKNIPKLPTSKVVLFSVISCANKSSIEFQEKYEQLIINMIHLYADLGYKIKLMSFCKLEGDEEAIKRIKSKCKIDINEYFYTGNIDEALLVIKQSQIIVASRFHAVILGLLFNKVVVPITYSDKTINVLNDLDFKGPIMDIKEISKIHLNKLTDEFLSYRLDITKAKANSVQHFAVLDKLLK